LACWRNARHWEPFAEFKNSSPHDQKLSPGQDSKVHRRRLTSRQKSPRRQTSPLKLVQPFGGQSDASQANDNAKCEDRSSHDQTSAPTLTAAIEADQISTMAFRHGASFFNVACNFFLAKMKIGPDRSVIGLDWDNIQTQHYFLERREAH
jgi:hypothetical protein